MKFELLIVDDEEIISMIYKTLSIKSGLHAAPKTFTDPKEALKHILQNKGKSRTYLILLDIHMPETDAWFFLDQLKSPDKDFEILVVIVTSSVNQFDKEKAAGYDEVISFLEKPIDENNFKEIMDLPKIKAFVSD
jgi:CheY-like chemotaxis protein